MFLLVAALLYGLGIHWGLPSEFSAAADSVVPHGPLAFFAKIDDPHVSKKYPAFHQLLVACVEAVVIIGAKLTGNLGEISSSWPYGLRDPVSVFSSMILAARLVSVAMALGILVCIRRITYCMRLGASGWVAIGLFGASGVTTYYARVGNFDIPFVFWFSCAVCVLWHYMFHDQRPLFAMGAAALAALSVATKDQSAGLAIGLLITMLIVKPVGSDHTWRYRLRLTLKAASVMALVYVIAAILPQPVRWLHHVQVWLLHKGPVTKFIEFENNLIGHSLLFGKTVAETAEVMSGAGLVLSAIGGVSLVRQGRMRELAVLVVPLIVYYLTIITPIRFVYERFMLPGGMLMCVLAAVGADALMNLAHQRNSALRLIPRVAIGLILISQFLTGYLLVTYVQLTDTKAQLNKKVSQRIPAGSRICWRGKGAHGIPNADLYQNYTLVQERDLSHWGHAFEHVFSEQTTGCKYLLSRRPVKETTGIRLLDEVRYPNWINDLVVPHCINEFYLYEQTSNVGNADSSRTADELSRVSR